jgi:mannitol-1-phosphate/altronate dehydrogenase
MTKKILFVGAGAIGRGYLPWLFDEKNCEFYYVDSNADIISQMAMRKCSTTYRVKNNILEKKIFKISGAYTPGQIDSNFKPDCVFVSVGPRNCIEAVKKLPKFNCPIVLCENEPNLVDQLKQTIDNKNVYFAVPDVITSNSAPKEIIDIDGLSVITEDGEMFVDADANLTNLTDRMHLISRDELLNKQWTAKLFIHNTPHCVAAYLGALCDKTYLHEAMEVPMVNRIVEGVMQEMLNSLKLRWDIPHDFLDWYAQKELSRFRNTMLFDPIKRVAREPLRKLELHGRLIGAANICISMGFIPENILIGIVAALNYSEGNDSDYHLNFIKDSLSHKQLLTRILGLRDGEALEIILSNRFDQLQNKVLQIKQGIEV